MNTPLTPEEEYKRLVGVSPHGRCLSKEQIEQGIKDPVAERARLAEEDREDDRQDIANLYRGRFKSR